MYFSTKNTRSFKKRLFITLRYVILQQHFSSTHYTSVKLASDYPPVFEHDGRSSGTTFIPGRHTRFPLFAVRGVVFPGGGHARRYLILYSVRARPQRVVGDLDRKTIRIMKKKLFL